MCFEYVCNAPKRERAESLELLQQAGLKSTVIEEPIFDRKILRTSFSEGGSCFEVKPINQQMKSRLYYRKF